MARRMVMLHMSQLRGPEGQLLHGLRHVPLQIAFLPPFMFNN